MVSHQEPDILKHKVKWALRSTAVKKASGCGEIPAELLKSLKDDAIKVVHLLCHPTNKGRLASRLTFSSVRTVLPSLV